MYPYWDSKRQFTRMVTTTDYNSRACEKLLTPNKTQLCISQMKHTAHIRMYKTLNRFFNHYLVVIMTNFTYSKWLHNQNVVN